MTIVKLAAAALVGLAALPALADTPPATLSISATETVEAEPDTVSVSAGVVTVAADAAAALSGNNRRMNDVIAALKKAGIQSRDIQTSRLSLQPQYRHQQGEAPQLTGFEARNEVQVTLRQTDKVGAVIDALVGAGANQIDGPTFSVADPNALLDKARVKAVQQARQRASLYAEAAGVKLQRVLSISENSGRPPVQPVFRAMAMEAQAAPAPVEAGAVSLSVTVNMQFELAPAR